MARISMSKNTSSGQTDLTEAIRKKAYELYEKRGRKSGNAMSDWLEAERLVKSQRKF